MLASTDTAWLSTPAIEAEPTWASMDFSRTGHTSPEGARRPYADRAGGADPCRDGTRGPPSRMPQPNSGGLRVWKSVASCQAFATLSVSASAQS